VVNTRKIPFKAFFPWYIKTKFYKIWICHWLAFINLISFFWQTLNKLILEYSSQDYGDPSQVVVFKNDLASCYETCYSNKTCLAYVWSNFSSICILKFQKINPTECANDTICATIPGSK
jgi:hypothetical protein